MHFLVPGLYAAAMGEKPKTPKAPNDKEEPKGRPRNAAAENTPNNPQPTHPPQTNTPPKKNNNTKQKQQTPNTNRKTQRPNHQEPKTANENKRKALTDRLRP